MKEILWEDNTGTKHRSIVRDSDPDSFAPKGIPANPPDINQMDWDEIKREIYNMLVERRLITWEDVQKSQDGITSVLKATLRKRLIELYRLSDKEV